MLAHVLKALPEEACGILAGRECAVEAVLPVTNHLHSPVRYSMEPLELLKCLRWMDEHNLEFLGVFHSHPRGPDRPSAVDMEENTNPGIVQLIWFPVPNGWEIKAFFGTNEFKEIPLVWEGEP